MNVVLKKGFTLIELVVVIAILAVLAGLIIPQISSMGRSTDMAASAKTQADIANNLQLYFVLQKRFPQGMDSLVDSGGLIYASDTTDANTQTRGLPYAGADGTRVQAQLAAGTLTNATNLEYLRSFTRSGFDYIHDHDTAVINSNNSATIKRFVVADGATAAPTTVNIAEVTGAALIAKLIPQGLTANERLVALGFGGRIASTGKTVLNSPIYPSCDGRYYGRYIAVFKVYASGERATLVGVMDSYGRTPDYTQQQYNESLPDGGRQG